MKASDQADAELENCLDRIEHALLVAETVATVCGTREEYSNESTWSLKDEANVALPYLDRAKVQLHRSRQADEVDREPTAASDRSWPERGRQRTRLGLAGPGRMRFAGGIAAPQRAPWPAEASRRQKQRAPTQRWMGSPAYKRN